MPERLKHPRRMSCALFFLAALLALAPRASAEKRYAFAGVRISAQLHVDGSMDVTESRTYSFSGSFRYANRTFPTDGPVAFSDFRVSENGTAFSDSSTEEPGTYGVTRGEDSIWVTWYFRARDEARTFDFHYRAQSAVRRFEDAAVLYYQFLSAEWDRESRNVQLRLLPPSPLSNDQVQQWLHGPLWAESRTETDGSIIAWCRVLPRRTYFEVRALYPPEVFSAAPREAALVRAGIQEEEARWAEQANAERRYALRKEDARQKRWATGKWLMIALGLAGILGGRSLYKKYGTRPQVPYQPDLVSEIPSKTPPALVDYLLRGRQVYGGALVSTLFDLARRGLIRLREEQKEIRMLFGGRRSLPEYYLDFDREKWATMAGSLRPFENMLLQFVFDGLAGGTSSLSFKTLRRSRNRFIRFFSVWQKVVKSEGAQQGWFDPESVHGMILSLLLAGGMLVLSVASVIFFGPWALVLFAATVAVFVLSVFIPHRTAEGQMEALKWKGLRRYLQKYEFLNAERTGLLDQMSEYFVYGTVLGLSKKAYERLAGLVPAESHASYIPWYVYHGTGSFTPEGFASAFSSMIVTASSTMSSASGTGGGASSGGGGGASSGGGGAG